MVHDVQIRSVPAESRLHLSAILDQSFSGVYRWHAKRTLRSVRWVREAVRRDAPVGLAMFTMLAPGLGYAYYVAVVPSQRSAGIGGLLLDDALRVLAEKSARVCLACVRAENARSIGLLQSRLFARTGFLELARSRGFLKTMLLWVRMVVAPGELVFARRFRD